MNVREDRTAPGAGGISAFLSDWTLTDLNTGAAYIGSARVGKAPQHLPSSERATTPQLLLPPGVVVTRLNRLLTGAWGGSARPTRRLAWSPPAAAPWLLPSTRCGPGKKCAGGSGPTTGSRAGDARRAFRGRRHDLVREPDAGNLHVRFDERRLETEQSRGVRHRHRRPPGSAPPPATRASRRRGVDARYARCRLFEGAFPTTPWTPQTAPTGSTGTFAVLSIRTFARYVTPPQGGN